MRDKCTRRCHALQPQCSFRVAIAFEALRSVSPINSFRSIARIEASTCAEIGPLAKDRFEQLPSAALLVIFSIIAIRRCQWSIWCDIC